ncbi:hypothetical protein C8R43DRAFT_1118057 [Mycena crocata]|nr:hypothetical protein C8R43DRAFT_1118057 [Mycena crocata]
MQRVLESYAEEEEGDEEDGNLPTGEKDDQWGGSQFEPDPDEGPDPHEAPDLDALVDLMDNDLSEPRVSAMRRQYFGMRIDYDEPEFEFNAEDMSGIRNHTASSSPVSTSHPDIMNEPGQILWWDVKQARNEYESLGIGPWTEEDERMERRRLKSIYTYPRLVNPTYDDLIEDFEIATIKRGSSPVNNEEITSILFIGDEEQVHCNFVQLMNHPVPRLMVSYPDASTLPPPHITAGANYFQEYINQMEGYQRELLCLLNLRVNAAAAIEIEANAPRGSYSQGWADNYRLATCLNENTQQEIRDHLALVDARSAIASGAFPVENVPIVPVIYVSSDSESERANSPAPSTGSGGTLASQLPSYPGSPHSSDLLWDAQGVDQNEIRRVNPRPSSPSSGSEGYYTSHEDEPEVSIRASRVVPNLKPGDTCTSEKPYGSFMPLPNDYEEDTCIIKSVVIFGTEAQYCLTYLRADKSVYTKFAPLPDSHILNPDFAPVHTAAVQEAILERAAELEIHEGFAI